MTVTTPSTFAPGGISTANAALIQDAANRYLQAFPNSNPYHVYVMFCTLMALSTNTQDVVIAANCLVQAQQAAQQRAQQAVTVMVAGALAVRRLVRWAIEVVNSARLSSLGLCRRSLLPSSALSLPSRFRCRLVLPSSLLSSSSRVRVVRPSSLWLCRLSLLPSSLSFPFRSPARSAPVQQWSTPAAPATCSGLTFVCHALVTGLVIRLATTPGAYGRRRSWTCSGRCWAMSFFEPSMMMAISRRGRLGW
ncbi:hypothetical protein DFJ77DRAFT_471690 [Powellomyces hirtus]|nr:hypothetical protein DFJ77DRAFT_471690 [Powellomyces hirtus]